MATDRSDVDGGESSSAPAVNRRRFLTAASGATVAGLSGCLGGGGGGDGGDGSDSTPTPTDDMSGGSTTGSPTESKPFEGETLTAAVWSGGEAWMSGWNDHIVPAFEEETGATVELETVWAEIISKIQAAPEDDPPWDTTVGDAYVGYYGRQSDLWLPIRYENVPNFEDVYQFLKDFREHEYGTPVTGMPQAILYRSDSDFKPSSWAEFASEEGANAKTAQEGSWYAYPAHIAAFAMDDLPQSDEMYDEEYHKDVFDTLYEMDTDFWYEGGADLREAIRNGVVNAGAFYMNIHHFSQENEGFGFDYPDEGSIWYWDHYRVVRGTDKRALAEKWIDFLLEPEMQKIGANVQYNAAANKDTTYERQILKDAYPQSDEEWEQQAFFQIPYLPNHWEKFNGWFKDIKTDAYTTG